MMMAIGTEKKRLHSCVLHPPMLLYDAGEVVAEATEINIYPSIEAAIEAGWSWIENHVTGEIDWTCPECSTEARKENPHG